MQLKKKTKQEEQKKKLYSTTFVLQINAFPSTIEKFQLFFSSIPFLCAAAVGCDSPKLKNIKKIYREKIEIIMQCNIIILNRKVCGKHVSSM